jgi:DNA-binding transcriptional regulator YhcF (GntR family)
MSIKEELKLIFEEEEVNKYALEVVKILSITNNKLTLAIDHVLTNKNYSAEDRVMLNKMINSLFKHNAKKIKTSHYDNKPYAQLFFNDFLAFINSEKLSMNEFKLVLGIYSILEKSNTYGNILLSLDLHLLAEKTQIDYSNLNKIIKSLEKKKIIIKENKSLFLNYNLFYRGSMVNYDIYSEIFNSKDKEKIKEKINNFIESCNEIDLELEENF